MKQLQIQDFDAVYALLEDSFPKEEYRDREEQRAIFNNPKFKVFGYEDEKGSLVGFISVWSLEGFEYIEHLATSKAVRNAGIGTKILQEYLSGCKLPVVLEVELPEGEKEQRRIAFYERNGFHMNGYEYLQPPFRKGDGMLPLLIMSYSAPITETAFEHFKKEVYREVYQYSAV